MSEKGYDLRHAREAAQIEKMKHLISQGLCAFCPENFEEYHDNPIEFQTQHWIVSKNDYPYKRTSLHLLVVSKTHVALLRELTVGARADLTEVLAQIETRWNLPSYAVGIRVGDPELNGGSVDHLHAHVVVGETGSANHEPVRFKMSSRAKE